MTNYNMIHGKLPKEGMYKRNFSLALEEFSKFCDSMLKKKNLSWVNLTNDLTLGTPNLGHWFLDGSDSDVRLV